ncbi:hypothetical protein A8924_2219 [Saccharopolyspora erythraea NRRL 2338]|uniref:Uncharacterized protein n=3 Tax=Saccharopolyspora erythraea TaxID=1836 RepID=A4FAQ6_SACEN|nr:hypothetical protein N599_29995 [Saccharopolyspora erythraea D]PFG94916.1 hypothetical protein A8924_2219 [Saccharopolyspora erythraea NRRL 2338]QRK91615.1 hypothetical protein JQX30_09650 [Saccharopolyspora erythraea]CAM01131.1 hypothetical protein SACE_1816 [Saccharopolyspora erythraea NRRL 2338]
MYMLFWLVVALVGFGVQYALRRRHDRSVSVPDLLLGWLLLSAVGLAGLLGAFAHTAFAAETAQGIGFPAGNPFQYEVAVANLAFAVLALVGFWNPDVRPVAGLVSGIWLGGDAIVHTHELVAHDNTAPNNAGLFLVIETVIALALLGLGGYAAASRRSAAPARV